MYAARLDLPLAVFARKFCSLVLVSVSVSVFVSGLRLFARELPKQQLLSSWNSSYSWSVLSEIYGPPAAAYIIESDVY